MSDVDFIAVIPARYNSTRLPGKPLELIGGKTMIEHVYDSCKIAGAQRILVATDDQRIFDEAAKFGAEPVMTSADHESGTDRVAEAVESLGVKPSTIIVNVQGDEPLAPPENIRQIAEEVNAAMIIAHDDVSYGHTTDKQMWHEISNFMVTLSHPYDEIELAYDANAVKVVTNNDGHALYFSRSLIPHPQVGNLLAEEYPNAYQRHIGMYGYTLASLRRFVGFDKSDYERIEKLEQLRALANGMRIEVLTSAHPQFSGVDTPEDLARVRRYVEEMTK